MDDQAYQLDILANKRARVLVCDDSQVQRGALAAYLTSRGYDVLEAEDGASALTELKNHQVDIVLLDLSMPAVNGFDVLTYLQKHRRSLPVIVMSGMPLEEIQHEIGTLPTSELPPLLLKPFDMEQLLPLMEMLLNNELPDVHEAVDSPDSAS